jgi:hypothetical protein
VDMSDADAAAFLMATAATSYQAGERLLRFREYFVTAVSADERARKLQALATLLRAQDDRLVLNWLDTECPAQFGEVPEERQREFLQGCYDAWQEEESATAS